jgi:CRP-like cAMP-binding protein
LRGNVTKSHRDNRLLATLSHELLDLMRHDLRERSLAQGKTVYEPGLPIDEIYFPQTGMISLMVVNKDGRAIEISSVGREGAIGLHSALGTRLSFTRATTQIAGRFSTILASSFGRIARDHAPVRELIARYTELSLAETQQIAACNAIHDAPARLCRWLLQCADHTGSNELPLTQELLAEMLNVRRTTVTILAQSLQQKGVIEYVRGHIRILDREGLKACACECYSVIRQETLSCSIGVRF